MSTREGTLLIRLLGPVEVLGDDGSVRHSESALRRMLLLALLATRPGWMTAPDWSLEHGQGDDQRCVTLVSRSVRQRSSVASRNASDLGSFWSGRRESNPHFQLGKLMFCR